jgi:hypothetical protein
MKLSHSRTKQYYNVLFAFSFVLLSNFGYGQVKSWEGTIIIPTYRWEEDVNPKFWAMEGGAKGAACRETGNNCP